MKANPLGRTGVVICCMCRLSCKDEIIRFSHRYVGEAEDAILEFCSRECWEDYFEVVDRLKSERDFRTECNTIYKEICPKCARRIREMVE